MTREEMDFIGGMNMCDEISNEAYKKIMCHCEEQEPKTGHWILVDEESNTWECTNCIEEGKDDWWQLNYGTPQDNKMDYCPHCGARMIEPQESEE